jgi:hypothetical protein
MNRGRTLVAAAIGVSLAIGGAGCGSSGGGPSPAERVAAQITDLSDKASDVSCTVGHGDRYDCRGDIPGAHGRFTAVSNSQGLYVNLSPGENPVINAHSGTGRMLKFSAELPSGWDERPERSSVYSPMPISSIQLPVRFASFHLPRAGPVWPVRGIPRDGVVVGVSPEEAVSEAAVRRADAPAIKPAGGHANASTSAYWAGWRFRVRANFGRKRPDPALVRQVNGLISSIVVVGHLCPCRGRT